MVRNVGIVIFMFAGFVVGFLLLGTADNSPQPTMTGLVRGSDTSSDSNQIDLLGHWTKLPALGQKYPDLELTDQNGMPVKLSNFKGKILLLEFAAVPCKGCQAFAGGKTHGGFAGVAVQPGLDSIHEYAKQFAGVEIGNHTQVVFVQILLFGKAMGRPSQKEVSGWSRHFEMRRSNNEYVLRGNPSLLGNSTRAYVPGFHLIDQNFVLCGDSCGHHPQQDLYRELLPMLGKLAQ